MQPSFPQVLVSPCQSSLGCRSKAILSMVSRAELYGDSTWICKTRPVSAFYLHSKDADHPSTLTPLALDRPTIILTFPVDTSQGQERLESPRSLGHMCYALHHQPGVACEPKVSHLRSTTKAQEEAREELPEQKLVVLLT